jgi:hypothetical protein
VLVPTDPVIDPAAWIPAFVDRELDPALDPIDPTLYLLDLVLVPTDPATGSVDRTWVPDGPVAPTILVATTPMRPPGTLPILIAAERFEPISEPIIATCSLPRGVYTILTWQDGTFTMVFILGTTGGELPLGHP